MNAPVAWQPPAARMELGVLLLLAWAAFVLVPLALGGIGLGWDALNHQIYLGWVADAPRFDRDLYAAKMQSYTYPYLYWPLYKLVALGASGVVAGMVLNSLYLAAVPALWWISRALVPGRSWEAVGLRAAAVALAFCSGAVLSHLDSTSNDLLAGIPLVWAVAFALAPLDAAGGDGWVRRRAVILSGLCAGMAVAFKFSNGPLALALPLLWAWPGPRLLPRVRAVVVGSVATMGSFALFYGYWGWQLWLAFGNPLYPFHEPTFAMLRRALGVGP